MSSKLEAIITRIREERNRQGDLPGSEWDAKNTPGDWVSIINHYVSSDIRKNGIVPNSVDFEDSLIKGAAVIIAALENLDNMGGRSELQ